MLASPMPDGSLAQHGRSS